MSKMAHLLSAGSLIAIAVAVPATSAAQTPIPAHVRVMTKSERIMRWLGPQGDVLLVVDEGTTFDVLDFDRQADSYWVVLPPDLHGTRRAGWIRASAVEPYVASPVSEAAQPAVSSEAGRAETPAPAVMTPSTSAAPVDEDKVTVSVRHDAPGASAADAAAAKKSYRFEDVHFDRDGFSIRSEDVERLRVAATALKEDPSLVVTIEGHTCNLGTGPYNLALGDRRATAVKAYLVQAGAPAERLLTVSQGEAGAEYDNSREETRRLNRRVALVPKTPR